MSNFLQTLGLARKARKVIYGIEMVAANSSSVLLILLSNDAGGVVTRRADRLSKAARAPALTLPYTGRELGHALGAPACAVVGVIDTGFATSLRYEAQKLPGTKEGV